MIVGLDPGHGGSNIGTHHYGVAEEHYVLAMGLLVRPMLQGLGLQVEISRTGDETVTFTQRASRLSKSKFILVLHVNAATNPTAKDLRTYLEPHSKIALSAATEMERVAPAIIAPIKPMPTMVGPAVPDQSRAYTTLKAYGGRAAILVELFFATHEPSARWATTTHGMAALATTLMAGCINAWQLTDEAKAPFV
jgi:N-acetylmuramoyl-L-alanine amidase